MLQSAKNKETISILDRLKQKGPPAGPVASLDMTLPEGEAMANEEDQGEADILQPIQQRPKKKARGQGLIPPTSVSGGY